MVYACITVAIVVFLGVDIGRTNPYNLVSLSGVVFFILTSFFCSKAPADVSYKYTDTRWGGRVQKRDKNAYFLFAHYNSTRLWYLIFVINNLMMAVAKCRLKEAL